MRISEGAVSTRVEDAIAERATFTIDLDLVALSGDVEETMPSLSSITIRLYDAQTQTLIREIADASDMYADGHLSFVSEIEDARIIGTDRQETHVVEIEWRWDSGEKAGLHRVYHTVVNFIGVPAVP